jgi:hypothetical protein
LKKAGPRAVPALIEEIRSNSRGKRQQCVNVAGVLRDKNLVPVLHEVLAADYPDHSTYFAIVALEHLRDPTSVGPLMAVMRRGGVHGAIAASALDKFPVSQSDIDELVAHANDDHYVAEVAAILILRTRASAEAEILQLYRKTTVDQGKDVIRRVVREAPRPDIEGALDSLDRELRGPEVGG